MQLATSNHGELIKMLLKKTLYTVAIPIGNFNDFTLRAIETLKHADLIIGEERSTTERILKKLSIENKEITILNEHNETKDAKELFHYIIEKDYSVALISEVGTPCIADPGAVLVNLFHEYNLRIVPIPGVSSITTALMVAGLTKDSYKYIGFLSPNKEMRRKELKLLSQEKLPCVILEAPYRMKQILTDIMDICGKNKQVLFAYKLTQPEEFIIKSDISTIVSKTNELKKGEFVLVLFNS